MGPRKNCHQMDGNADVGKCDEFKDSDAVLLIAEKP